MIPRILTMIPVRESQRGRYNLPRSVYASPQKKRLVSTKLSLQDLTQRGWKCCISMH